MYDFTRLGFHKNIFDIKNKYIKACRAKLHNCSYEILSCGP